MNLLTRAIIITTISISIITAASIIIHILLIQTPTPLNINYIKNNTKTLANINLNKAYLCNRSNTILPSNTYNSLHIECTNCKIKNISIYKQQDNTPLKNITPNNTQNIEIPLYNYCNTTGISINIEPEPTPPTDTNNIKAYHTQNIPKTDIIKHIITTLTLTIISIILYSYHKHKP